MKNVKRPGPAAFYVGLLELGMFFALLDAYGWWWTLFAALPVMFIVHYVTIGGDFLGPN